MRVPMENKTAIELCYVTHIKVQSSQFVRLKWMWMRDCWKTSIFQQLSLDILDWWLYRGWWRRRGRFLDLLIDSIRSNSIQTWIHRNKKNLVLLRTRTRTRTRKLYTHMQSLQISNHVFHPDSEAQKIRHNGPWYCLRLECRLYRFTYACRSSNTVSFVDFQFLTTTGAPIREWSLRSPSSQDLRTFMIIVIHPESYYRECVCPKRNQSIIPMNLWFSMVQLKWKLGIFVRIEELFGEWMRINPPIDLNRLSR